MRALLLLLLAACGTNQTPQPAPVPTLPSCVPDLDGTIVAAELPIALGATVDEFTATNRAVDLVAQNGVWDFTQETAADDASIVSIGPVALGAQWYAGSFPSGQFVVDAGGGLDGIYHQDDQALWLDGTASQDPAPAAGKTLVAYAQPIAVLRFPIADGTAFESIGALPAATVDGLPFVGTDTVDVDVTGTGRLDVPYVDFAPVLRVRTHVTRTASSGGASVSKRTTIFMFECFGEVVHAESAPDEPNADFTTAAYLRRFALPGVKS